MAAASDGAGAEVVNLAEKLAQVGAFWSPKTVGLFNGHDLMVVRVQGEFVWLDHPDTDDFIMVLAGRLLIDLPDRTVTLEPGELFVVPRGIRHRTRAEGEAQLLLIEPSGTPNTGDPTTAAPRDVI